ncbi:MAG: MarR family winged helix-turn-helix transcriptional regulator [Hyphomonadaceae bacterium]
MVQRVEPDLADKLHAAAIRLLRRVREADNETGLSAPKLSALSVLVFAGPQSLGALAEAEQVTAPTMSKLVGDLESAGLVAKKADKNDARAIRIEATSRGRALMQAGRARRLALIREGLARLTKAERTQLEAAAALMLKLASP